MQRRLLLSFAFIFGLFVLVGCETSPDIAAPVNVTATPGPDGVTLTWEDASDNEDGFAIYRKNAAAPDVDFQRLDETEANVTSYTDTAVEVGRSYLYEVTAKLGTQESSPARISEAVTLDLEPGIWNELSGGEGTVCADGSDYSYFAHAGSAEKLVIDFQGGGACWDSLSCSSPYSNPNPNLGFGLYINQLSPGDVVTDNPQGIYDRANEENPIGDWNHVYIPYCTGDLHIGNATQSYTDPQTEEPYEIEHKGAVNAQAALDWTFETFADPEAVFITGCSAGAYGAAYWTATIKAQYPDTPIYQLGDCGAGVASDAFTQTIAASWNATATFPEITFDADAVTSTYVNTLENADNLKMAQYNSLFDGVQTFFYAFGIGADLPPSAEVASEWSETMLTSIDTIEASSDDFTAYISLADDDGNTDNGTQHCIIGAENFYDVETNGVNFRDWLDDYVNGREVESVKVTQGEE